MFLIDQMCQCLHINCQSSFKSLDLDHPLVLGSDTEYKSFGSDSPQPVSLVELNDLTRDLGLPKEKGLCVFHVLAREKLFSSIGLPIFWILTIYMSVNSSSEELSDFSGANLCEINLEEAYYRIEFLNDAQSCEMCCDQLERLIYNYARNNNDNSIDLKLIRETQQIIIRCARKSNKLLSDELKSYLQQILENVKQQPIMALLFPSQSSKNK
ncbi:hypothetical protein NPIL_579271 [Nephila pilipes]|uniref:Uncharacterized protein n=1 Tax=Nephila pilipes TaxID=299642 RepID=A0A8X6PS72_NEPPI|nr:hypothetical protein NPIL_579271 [Nephila pilipes]